MNNLIIYMKEGNMRAIYSKHDIILFILFKWQIHKGFLNVNTCMEDYELTPITTTQLFHLFIYLWNIFHTYVTFNLTCTSTSEKHYKACIVTEEIMRKSSTCWHCSLTNCKLTNGPLRLQRKHFILFYLIKQCK